VLIEGFVTQIDLLHLTRTYPRQTASALADVSLRVASGTLTALLGPSGSGKSTLLKLIAGIEAPEHGDICLDGQSILARPAHQRGTVLVFQKAYLFPFLSVTENVAFGLKIQRIHPARIRAEVDRILDLVELPGMGSRRPTQLSGGEQQRVALARALVTQPRVLLLDEPFSSLDAAVRQTLQEAVRRIQRELGITTVLVTHDLAEALAMADQVALLDHGALLASDTPQRLFQRPPTSRAALLMGISTFLHGELVGNHLHTNLGRFRIEAPDIPSGRATYAIRPEHIRLCAQPGLNALPAQLLTHSFRGEHSEYQLRVGDQLLRVRSMSPTTYSEGQQLFIQFPPELLFPIADTPELGIT